MPLDFIKDSFIGLLLDFIKNSFFAKQCSLIDNGAVLRSLFPLITEKSLSDVDFSVEDIKNIISKLDSNKVHGDDMISIRMLKLCEKSISKPFSIIFKSGQRKAFSHLNGKKMSYQFIKKTTSSVLATTDLSLFSQSVAKV